MLSADHLCASGATPAPAPDLSICDTLDCLAPRMAEAVMATLVDCKAQGLDAVVYETRRSAALQAHYYALGRTIIPPHQTVTNARDAMHGWHFFGLAVDVIHRTKQWDAPMAWFARVGGIAESHGLDWGGRWKTADLPHLQWGQCGASPRNAPAIYTNTPGTDADKLLAVWKACGATFPA